MYIKVVKSPTSKFSKVYLTEGYRDENGKVKQRNIKCYGNLEELQEKDPNILEKLRAEAKSMGLNQTSVLINFNQENSEKGSDLNYGYFFLDAIYAKLSISSFLKKIKNKARCEYDLGEIVKLLVYSRIMEPASKQATFERRTTFFKPFEVDLNSIYRSLSVLSEIKDDLQYFLHQEVSRHYQRDCSVVFYDVTNYYFEIDEEDDLKKKGVSKENKKSPIVQMGLFIDSSGLPISYKLFPGNTSDTLTLIPILGEMKKRYGLKKVILTADKGLNSGKNLAYLVNKGDGYIVSQKLRGSSRKFIDQVLDEEGYRYNTKGTFKIKSFLRGREVKDQDGKIQTIEEKVICFWSKDYDEREKHKREDLEEKISSFLDNPSKYNASNSFGVKKYLKMKHVNQETGEIEKVKPHLEFNQEKYARDKEMDGYYVLVSSEVDLEDTAIIEKYRGLWKIEETFKVMKSDLEGRPVYVRRNDRVEGHFFICYLALLLSRILEFELDHKFSVKKIQTSLKQTTCRLIKKGIYSLNTQDEVFRALEEKFKVSLNYDFVRIEQLRQYKKKIEKVYNKK